MGRVVLSRPPGTVQGMSDSDARIREMARAAFQADVTVDALVRAGAISAEDHVAAQAEFDRLQAEAVRSTDETTPPPRSSPAELRSHWRKRAGWLAQLGLSPTDDAPVEIIQEVANAALILLDENERLRGDLVEQCEALLRVLFRDMLDKPGAHTGQHTSSTGPVARERDGRLCVITGVPYTWGADGSRYFDPAVAQRLDLGFRAMFAGGSSVSIRAWADLADTPAADRPTALLADGVHLERLRFVPSDVLDRAVADAAIAHDTSVHGAEDAFADYVDNPSPQQAEVTEQRIAALRYEWEVLVAVVRRLLDTQKDDRRIGRWLYGSLGEGTRISLGDMSDWPWLVDYRDDS